MGARSDGTLRGLMRSNEGVRLDQGRDGAYGLSSDGRAATLIFTPSVWSEPHIWSGTVRDGLRPIYDQPDFCSARATEADGDVMAVVLGCGGEDLQRVVVRSGGAERTFTSGGYGVQVAGRYVAFTGRSAGEVVLYDAVAGREVLRAGRAGGPRLDPIALQGDGKLLVAIGDPLEGTDTDTALVSPAGPGLRRLAISPRTIRGFARDRILTLQAVAPSPAREALRSASKCAPGAVPASWSSARRPRRSPSGRRTWSGCAAACGPTAAPR